MALKASIFALCLNIVATQINTAPTFGCFGPRSSHAASETPLLLIGQHQSIYFGETRFNRKKDQS